MFYVCTRFGFVVNVNNGWCDKNVRHAYPFASFADADAFGKSYEHLYGYYAIVSPTFNTFK